MAKLKVINHEEKNGRLLVTVEVRRWWANPTTRQFIQSGAQFEKHPNKDDAWYTYPEFQTVAWHASPDKKYHKFLTGWKKGYDFFKV